MVQRKPMAPWASEMREREQGLPNFFSFLPLFLLPSHYFIFSYKDSRATIKKKSLGVKKKNAKVTLITSVW